MENMIFSSRIIILISAITGILLLLSSTFSIRSTRKVVLKKRVGTKQSKLNALINTFLDKLDNIEFFNEIFDKGQFIYGYFSAKDERKNRALSKMLLFKGLIFNILLLIVLAILIKQPIIVIFSVLIIIMIEFLYISSSVAKKKQILKDEFHILIREFISSYIINSNVRRAFESTIKDLSPEYQVHVSRLVNQLTTVSDIEEAFINFNKRIDYPLCACFVSIIQTSFKDNSNVITNLLDLQSIVDDERMNEKKRTSALASSNNGIYFWIVLCIFEIIAGGTYCKTPVGNYFLTTYTGQNLLIATVIFIIMSLVCKRISNSV